MAFTSWLNKGTLITLEDGSQKAIESIEAGDSVQTFDIGGEDFDGAHIEQNEQSNTEVKQVKEKTVDGGNVATLTFDNGSKLTLTKDYPLFGYSENDSWLTADEDATKDLYGNSDEDGDDGRFTEIENGKEVFLDGDDSIAIITNTESHTDEDEFTMYTIDSLEKGHTVFANNILIAAGNAF